jgi:perosamine synthetase
MYRDVPFAERFAEYVGARYALPVANGTAAILSALLGAGVGPGDEVLTVSYSWFCTATAVLAVNAVPIFVDVDPETFTMDPERIVERITPRTKAILGVSLYGHPARYDRIVEIARAHGLVVLDDACQSTGASLHGKKLGSLADITAFSFSGKPIVSTGGGVVVTSDRAMFERSMLGGQHPSFISSEARDPAVHAFASTGGYGQNLRIDAVCMERAYEQLERLDAVNGWRRTNAARLTERLSRIPGIRPPIEGPGAHHVYHFYTALFDAAHHGITRKEFVDALYAEGVPVVTYISSVNFLKHLDGTPWDAGAVHRRHLFQELARTGRCGPYVLPPDARPDYSEGSLPQTERLVGMEFNLPQKWINPPFGPDRMDQYADAIEKVLACTDEIRAARQRNDLPRPRHHFLVACESDA